MGNEIGEVALKSILFKGRSDLYFCYIKSEKIAYVLALLAQTSSLKDSLYFTELILSASKLPHTILHFAAGDLPSSIVLAETMSLLSSLRLGTAQGYIRKENSSILEQEYENIVRKIAEENHPSPFITSEDFKVEEIKIISTPQMLGASTQIEESDTNLSKGPIKDINKGQDNKGQKQSERVSLILDFVRKNNGVSIKEIAAVVRGCSEKTIQRELGNLIERGLIARKGERRWSLYTATTKTS